MKNIKINSKTLVVVDMIGSFATKKGPGIIYSVDEHVQSFNYPSHCTKPIQEKILKK